MRDLIGDGAFKGLAWDRSKWMRFRRVANVHSTSRLISEDIVA